jgi:hypothetical protein
MAIKKKKPDPLVPKTIELIIPLEPYKIYLYKQRKKNLLTPIPYTFKSNYQYILPLIQNNDQTTILTV